MKKQIGKALAIGALVLATVCLSGCGRKTISLNDYLDYHIAGYDGMGSVTSDVKESDIVEDNLKAFGVGDTDESFFSALNTYDVVSGLSGEWDKSSELSNGDTITFTWDEDKIKRIEEAYPVRLKHSKVKVKVKDLPKVETYDAFQDIDIEFTDTAPNGSASVVKNGDAADLDVTVAPDSGLRNGDEITVKLDVPDTFTRSYGKIPAETTKKIKVKGLDSFVMKSTEIPEDQLNAMKKQAEDVQKADFQDYDATIDSMTYVGNYLLTMKDDFVQKNSITLGSWTSYNYLYLVYKMDVSASGAKKSYYWYCRFQDLKVLGDGTFRVDTSNYSNVSSWDGTVDVGSESLPGFADIDSLFAFCVTPNIDSFDYEDNVSAKDGANKS